MRKVFEILNQNELPMRGKLISWKDIKKGFVFKIESELYGYNEIEFIRYDRERKRLFLKYNNEECDILTGGFCAGRIGALLIKYDSHKVDNFEIYNKLKMNEVGIMWGDIRCGEILKTYHSEYGYKDFEFLRYEKERRTLCLKYNGDECDILTDSFKNGNIGRIIGEITNEFKYKIGTQLKDYNRDLILTSREYRKVEQKVNRKDNVHIANYKWYEYRCNKCGYKGEIEETNLKSKKQGCSCCANQIVVSGINDIKTTAPWMIDLGISKEDSIKYTKSSSNKIIVTCPDCGRKKKKTISNLYNTKSIGCYCGDGRSYISKYIQSVLDELGVEYDMEVKYNWNKYINPLNNKLTQAYIDFVIHKDNKEITLEADGAFHRKDNHMNGQTKEMSKYIDNQRDENCFNYFGEHTIRISDEGDIKESILNSKLSELFDLNMVNWSKCEEYAIKSNKVKEISEYWSNKDEHETTKDLEKVFNLSKSTIIRYLKKGTRLNFCSYNSKEEVKKATSKNGKSTRKTVEMFKGGVLLGVFESCHKLDELSEELFGVKLFFSNISSVCNKKLPQYKGYTFKYVD